MMMWWLLAALSFENVHAAGTAFSGKGTNDWLFENTTQDDDYVAIKSS
jgi:hypothetical protein